MVVLHPERSASAPLWLLPHPWRPLALSDFAVLRIFVLWFVAVVILGRLVHCWHFGFHSGIVGAIIAGVGVGTIAGGTSAVVIVIVVAVLCGRAGRSVAVAVAVG